MFQEARRSLVGLIRYFVWRKDADACFAATKQAFARSLVAYVPAFPLSMAVSYWDADPVTKSRLGGVGWTVYVLEFVAVNALWLGMAFMAAALLRRREHYFRYATAANWLALILAAYTFVVLGLHEATGFIESDTLAGLVFSGVAMVLGVAVVYWIWATLHQALKFRWWQSIPIILVMIAVSIFVSAFATVVARIESAPPAPIVSATPAPPA